MHRNHFWLEKSLSCRWLKAGFVCACPVFKLFPGTCFWLLLDTEYRPVVLPTMIACSILCYSGSIFLFIYFFCHSQWVHVASYQKPSVFQFRADGAKDGLQISSPTHKSCQAYCKNICLAVNLRHHSLHLTCAKPPVTITDIYQRTANTCHPSKLYLWKIYMHKRACWLS